VLLINPQFYKVAFCCTAVVEALNRWLILLVLGLPTLFLSACSYQLPLAPAADDSFPLQWSAAPSVDLSEPSQDWLKLYLDDRGLALVAETLQQNYQLRANQQRVLRAVLQADIAGANLWPTVTGNLNGGRSKQATSLGLSLIHISEPTRPY